MKSARKHELQTNELADAMRHLLEQARPHAWTIGLVAAAVVVLIVVLIVMPAVRGSAATRDPAAEAFKIALVDAQTQPLRDFLREFPSAPQVPAAKLLLADRCLTEAVSGETGKGEEGKAKAAGLLTEAKTVYEQVAQSDPAHEPMARVGLALVMIQQGDVEKGVAALQEVAKNAPQSIAADIARSHVEALAGYKPVQFSNEPIVEPKSETKAPESPKAPAAEKPAPVAEKPAPVTPKPPEAPKPAQAPTPKG